MKELNKFSKSRWLRYVGKPGNNFKKVTTVKTLWRCSNQLSELNYLKTFFLPLKIWDAVHESQKLKFELRIINS